MHIAMNAALVVHAGDEGRAAIVIPDASTTKAINEWRHSNVLGAVTVHACGQAPAPPILRIRVGSP